MIYAKYTVHRGEVATVLKLINVFEGVIVSLTVVSISVQHMHLGMFLRVCSHHYSWPQRAIIYVFPTVCRHCLSDQRCLASVVVLALPKTLSTHVFIS